VKNSPIFHPERHPLLWTPSREAPGGPHGLTTGGTVHWCLMRAIPSIDTVVSPSSAGATPPTPFGVPRGTVLVVARSILRRRVRAAPDGAPDESCVAQLARHRVQRQCLQLAGPASDVGPIGLTRPLLVLTRFCNIDRSTPTLVSLQGLAGPASPVACLLSPSEGVRRRTSYRCPFLWPGHARSGCRHPSTWTSRLSGRLTTLSAIW